MAGPSFRGISLNSASAVYGGANTAWAAYKLLTKETPHIDVSKQPYRPPQWKNLPNNVDELILIRPCIAHEFDARLSGGQTESMMMAYFFDAVMREEHTTNLKITEHPIQTGANIVDHAYMMPTRLVLEIKMSDVVDSLVPGQFDEPDRKPEDYAVNEAVWDDQQKKYVTTPRQTTPSGAIAGKKTKSVNAYQILKQLQVDRIPLQVTTRLNLYKNMLIEQLSAPDDYSTIHGMKCTVVFRQLMVAQVNLEAKKSALPEVTDIIDSGNISSSQPPVSSTGSFTETVKDKLFAVNESLQDIVSSVNQTVGTVADQLKRTANDLLGSVDGICADAQKSITSIFNIKPEISLSGFPDVGSLTGSIQNASNEIASSAVSLGNSLPSLGSITTTADLSASSVAASVRQQVGLWDDLRIAVNRGLQ